VTGEQAGILAIAFGGALRDGADLAGIRHMDRVPQSGEQPADPRAVRSRFHDDRRTRIATRKRRQAFARIGDDFLGDNLARFIEDTRRVVTVPEILYAFSFLLFRLFIRALCFDDPMRDKSKNQENDCRIPRTYTKSMRSRKGQVYSASDEKYRERGENSHPVEKNKREVMRAEQNHHRRIKQTSAISSYRQQQRHRQRKHERHLHSQPAQRIPAAQGRRFVRPRKQLGQRKYEKSAEHQACHCRARRYSIRQRCGDEPY